MAAAAEIFDDLSTLADATRSRMLVLLERHELTVSELCTVLQLAAVHGQPSSQDSLGQRMGRVPSRWHQPVLHALA